MTAQAERIQPNVMHILLPRHDMIGFRDQEDKDFKLGEVYRAGERRDEAIDLLR